MEFLTALIAKYGLIAVFLGCLAEGESMAIIAGFFAHQGVLSLAPAVFAVAIGAFLGDTLLYVAGRQFRDWSWVRAARAKPGFSHALDLARKRPRAFVFFNRYVYGMRLLGGIAAGLAGIPVQTLLVWNALSSVGWAALFMSIGWFFGLSAEALLGKALHTHQRLLIGLAILAAVTVLGIVLARRVTRREKAREESGSHAEQSINSR
jgi:membrane protein DedA with SNARE-associated domain